MNDVVLSLILSGCSIVLYLLVSIIINIVGNKKTKNNENSFAKKTYEHFEIVVGTYLIFILVLVNLFIWLGFIISAIYAFCVVALILIKNICFNSIKNFYKIYHLVNKNEVDIDDYVTIILINGKELEGKITKFSYDKLEIALPSNEVVIVLGKQISTIINKSKNVINSKVIITLALNYKYDKVVKILEENLSSLIQDYAVILEGPNIAGVGNISSTKYEIVITFKSNYSDVDVISYAIRTKVLKLLGDKYE